MHTLYSFRAVCTLLLILFFCTSGRAQTTIATLDFDGTAPEMTLSTNVAFFDNNADGFFGIHDANDDLADGTPGDTGDANANDVALVNSAPINGDFFIVNDLDDEGDNGAEEATLTFGPVNVAGRAQLLFSFDYRVDGFNRGDDVFYQLVEDGVELAEVNFIDGNGDSGTGSGHISIPVSDGTASVSLKLRIVQNGDDVAGFDNFSVTADNPDDPCGIRSLGPAEVLCLTESTASDTDLFQISIPYTGVDADAYLVVFAGATVAANDVSATTTNLGDDFTTHSDGTLLLANSAGEFEEGDEIRVSIRDSSGNCAVDLDVSTTDNQCSNPCDPNINVNNIRFLCTSNTAGNDGGSALVRFTNGPEPGVVVLINDADVVVSGADPAVDDDGDIVLDGLVEGRSYTLTLSGGGCSDGMEKEVPFTFQAGQCPEATLVINELNFDPNGSGFDANEDGEVDGQTDEYVELFNATEGELDVSNFTLADNAGVFFTFPAGTLIPAGAAFTVFAVAPTGDIGCPTAASQRQFGSANPTTIGLGTSDVVLLNNPAGVTLNSVSYAENNQFNQSLAREVDFTGTFIGHTEIAENPVVGSPCERNVMDAQLPVELLDLGAAAGAKQVELQWATTNETDNAFFSVERSKQGRDWMEIGTVNAGVFSDNSYTFKDEAPLLGRNTYRLVQYDLDGSWEVHGPVIVEFAGAELRVFPNPATTHLGFNRSVDANDRVFLISGNGTLLQELPLGASQVDVSNFPRGIYWVRWSGNGGTETVRFVKE